MSYNKYPSTPFEMAYDFISHPLVIMVIGVLLTHWLAMRAIRRRR